VNTTVVGKAYHFNICFRSQTLTGNAGIILMRDFIEKIRLGELIDSELNIKARERGYPESENVLSLCWNAILGGKCLLDLNVLRGDAGLPELLGVESVMAPTTAGEFLRAFSIGDLSDLRRINRLAAERVRPLQKSDRLTIDLDASLYEQCSRCKQGSRMNYKGKVGYYPLFAFWAEEKEMLATHLQAGNAGAAPKAVWFLEQALLNAPQELPRYLRADSEFYTWDLIDFCEQQADKITYTITADQSVGLMEEITSLPEKAWQFYTPGAQVAELEYAPTNHAAHRYVIKRQKVEDKKKESIWRYHVVITNERRLGPKKLMKWALGRCTMENLIKEHKNDFGFEKMPTKLFHANWAWLQISQLAWNLVAWFKRICLPEECQAMTLGTLRHRLLKVAGKIVHQGRQLFLALTDENLFQHWWSFALKQLDQLIVSSA
jgi:Transposase DDE domain group 1